MFNSIGRKLGIKTKRRSQPSWDAPMAVSEPLSLPGTAFGLSACGLISSRSTPSLGSLGLVRTRTREDLQSPPKARSGASKGPVAAATAAAAGVVGDFGGEATEKLTFPQPHRSSQAYSLSSTSIAYDSTLTTTTTTRTTTGAATTTTTTTAAAVATATATTSASATTTGLAAAAAATSTSIAASARSSTEFGSRLLNPLRHSGISKSVSATSRLLNEGGDLNTEKKTALWLSRQKKKGPEEEEEQQQQQQQQQGRNHAAETSAVVSSRKSYDDIYEEVVAASGGAKPPNATGQAEKHARSASDPLGHVQERFSLGGGRVTDKDVVSVDSLWSAGGAGGHSLHHSILTQDHSDSSTYIDSVGSEMKWGDSYSDLSAFSVRSSNQSSGFESGQSTVADAGRLSPQSSLDGSVLMGGFGERVVSRFPLPTREGVAHSAKIPSAERHDSESVLYFAQTRLNRGVTVSSASDLDRQDKTCHAAKHESQTQNKSSLFDEAASELGDTLVLSRRPLDPLKKTKVPEPELKQIQKQAVLSYLRQRQATEGVGARPAQFRDQPPDTAEKPTLLKPIAVKLLEDNDIPPELPPKMFKSSELLHGLVRDVNETTTTTTTTATNCGDHPATAGLRELCDAKQPPPRPPPKTFKLNGQRATAILKTMVTPPPIREKPEKLRQRRANDSSVVMAKMVFIPQSPLNVPAQADPAKTTASEYPRCPQTYGSPAVSPSSLADSRCHTMMTDTVVLTSLAVPPSLPPPPPPLQHPEVAISSTLKGGGGLAAPVVIVDKKDAALSRLCRSSPTTAKSDETPRRSRLDDGYGTSLDDEDESATSANEPSMLAAKSDPEAVHSAKLAGMTRLRLAQEEAAVREEIAANDAFGFELRARLEQLGRQRELRKLTNYISEVDDIAALVVSLALRIGRTAAALQALAAEGVAAQKVQLVQKLEKTEQELDEARRLETNCEKRWASFGAHLATFLEPKELIGRYLHFMKKRADLLVKQRTIHDRQQMYKTQ